MKVELNNHLHEMTHTGAKLMSAASYGVSGGLVVGDVMNFLNENAAGIGVLIGVATFAVNLYYQRKNSKIIELKALNHNKEG